MKAVVDEGPGQVVGSPDGMDVAGEMEVEVLHRYDLAVPTGRGAALDPEHRTERRLPDADGCLAADRLEPLRQADRRRRLAFTERGRGDRRDDNVRPARSLGLESG